MANENSWNDLTTQLDQRLVQRRKAKRDPVWEAFRNLSPEGFGKSDNTQIANAYRTLIVKPNKKSDKQDSAEIEFEWAAAATSVKAETSGAPCLLIWAYALPMLTDALGERLWWEVLGELKTARESALNDPSADCSRLVLAAELGLVLAWGLQNLKSSARLAASSWTTLNTYLQSEEERLSDALSGEASRLPWALAAAMRCVLIGEQAFKQKPRQTMLAELNEMAEWLIHMVRWNGSFCFQSMDSRVSQSLIDSAAALTNDPGLVKAYNFACRTAGKVTNNRLATETELPESAMYCEPARLISMRPSWFKHHGWIVASFASKEAPRVEVSSGKRMIFQGQWETTIQIDGQDCQVQSDWEEVCWHTDDDVHYIEMEQCWTNGVTLQRQLMVVREDGAVLLADTVFGPGDAQINYQSTLPVAASLQSQPEPETREIILADDKPRAMVLPIGFPEWRVGASAGSMVVRDGTLMISARGESRLYAPVWIDFERRRFTRPRTWRNLTVASRLEISKPNEAIASRVQFGSEQWIIFRAMGPPDAWTFCGKHLAADFFCGRFDPEDGSVEPLITVDSPSESSLTPACS